MIATSTSRVRGVDALRGIAALAVFICHVNAYWPFLHLPSKLPQLSELGAHGVDLFIVISGFCLALPLATDAPVVSAGPFWARRALRILPAYYVALFAAFVLASLPATWHLLVAAPATGWDLLAYATTVQTWIPDRAGTINGSLWSVALEVHLYLVFPLLVLWWRRLGLWSLLAFTAVLSVGWDLLYGHFPGTALGYSFVIPDRLVQFVAGMCCAMLTTQSRIPRRKVLVVWLVVTLVVAAALNTVNVLIGAALVWTLPAVATVLLFAGPVGDRFAQTPLDAFGLRSYSFYLVHQPMILVCAPVIAYVTMPWPVTWLVGGGLVLVATYGVARLLYRYVELPSHRLSRQIRVR